MSETLTETTPPNKSVAPLTVLLGVVFVVFCGILVFVYVATKRANPVMLDQQGKPLGQNSAPANPGAR
jgi:flagellar basal body-associated protein FliL